MWSTMLVRQVQRELTLSMYTFVCIHVFVTTTQMLIVDLCLINVMDVISLEKCHFENEVLFSCHPSLPGNYFL